MVCHSIGGRIALPVVVMKSRASSEICVDDDSMGQEMLGWEMPPWMQLGRAAMACHGFGIRILPSVPHASVSPLICKQRKARSRRPLT